MVKKEEMTLKITETEKTLRLMVADTQQNGITSHEIWDGIWKTLDRTTMFEQETRG